MGSYTPTRQFGLGANTWFEYGGGPKYMFGPPHVTITSIFPTSKTERANKLSNTLLIIR